MSLSQVIAVIAIIIPCVTALLVAYWHRKQMRQVEIYRQDPAAGLLPPDSAVYRAVKTHREIIVGVGLPLILLCWEMTRGHPITRTWVLAVSICIASIVLSLVLFLLRQTVENLSGVVSILQQHTAVQRTIVETLLDTAPSHVAITDGNPAHSDTSEASRQRTDGGT